MLVEKKVETTRAKPLTEASFKIILRYHSYSAQDLQTSNSNQLRFGPNSHVRFIQQADNLFHNLISQLSISR